MRLSTPIGNLTPSFSATACASSIIARARARVPGSATMSSSVAWVSALIGLKLRLPHSLTQISSRMRGLTGAFSPAAMKTSDRRVTRSLRLPSGSPRVKRSPSISSITPGSGTSAAG